LPSEDRQSSFSDMVEIALGGGVFVRLKRDLAGRSVGAVGLGCMSFGGIYGGTDEDESFACLAEALALGVDHWDVAEIYGKAQCESVIGKFLSQTRAEVSIATKAGSMPSHPAISAMMRRRCAGRWKGR
jgi:aryl-alcohol dehydrogenase-like predicted oxidoreductase